MLDKMAASLLREKETMVLYLRLKLDQRDWHGVCDAANDIRDIDAKLELLGELQLTPYKKKQNDAE